MIRLAAVLTALSPPAWSESPDDLVMRASEAASAEIYYNNSADQTSSSFEGVLEFEGVSAFVSIRVTKDEEHITVQPVGTYIAIPDQAAVADGDSIVIEIYPAAF